MSALSNIHSYVFCDLPLVIHYGIEAMLTNGLAEIEYSRDGSWDIAAVCIEGRHNLTPEERDAGKSPVDLHQCSRRDRAYLIIERLERLQERYGRKSRTPFWNSLRPTAMTPARRSTTPVATTRCIGELRDENRSHSGTG